MFLRLHSLIGRHRIGPCVAGSSPRKSISRSFIGLKNAGLRAIKSAVSRMVSRVPHNEERALSAFRGKLVALGAHSTHEAGWVTVLLLSPPRVCVCLAMHVSRAHLPTNKR